MIPDCALSMRAGSVLEPPRQRGCDLVRVRRALERRAAGDRVGHRRETPSKPVFRPGIRSVLLTASQVRFSPVSSVSAVWHASAWPRRTVPGPVPMLCDSPSQKMSVVGQCKGVIVARCRKPVTTSRRTDNDQRGGTGSTSRSSVAELSAEGWELDDEVGRRTSSRRARHVPSNTRFGGGGASANRREIHGRGRLLPRGSSPLADFRELNEDSRASSYLVSTGRRTVAVGRNGSDGTRTRDLRRDRPAF